MNEPEITASFKCDAAGFYSMENVASAKIKVRQTKTLAPREVRARSTPRAIHRSVGLKIVSDLSRKRNIFQDSRLITENKWRKRPAMIGIKISI